MRKKQNTMLAKIEARHQVELMRARLFAIQQSKDMMLISVGDEFGFGPDRAKRLSEAFDETFTKYAELTISDAKADKEIWYTKAKVDERLRQICGEHFVCWEDRYR